MNVRSDVDRYIIELAKSVLAIVPLTDVVKGRLPFVVSEVPCAIPEAPILRLAVAADKPLACVAGTPNGAPELSGPNRISSVFVPSKSAVTGEAGNDGSPPAGTSCATAIEAP